MLPEANITIATGVGSIEHFFAKKDQFRKVSGKKPPTIWPFDQSPCPPEIHEFMRSKEAGYEKILKECGININYASAQVLNRRQFRTEKFETFVIATKDENSDDWQQAADRVKLFLIESARVSGIKGISETRLKVLDVEIRNPDRMYRDVSTVIPGNTHLQRTILESESQVFERVKKVFSGTLVSVGYAMRGPKEQTADRKPTLMIAVRPGTKSLFLFDESKIERLIEEIEQSTGTDLYMEIFSDIIELATAC